MIYRLKSAKVLNTSGCTIDQLAARPLSCNSRSSINELSIFSEDVFENKNKECKANAHDKKNGGSNQFCGMHGYRRIRI
jgi:hypothetical protein